MKIKILLIFWLCILHFLNAQVSINTTNATPDSSAMLDISSTDKGMLIPRMTEAQRNLINNAATGLMVFQTDGLMGFYFWAGSQWLHLSETPLNLNTNAIPKWDGQKFTNSTVSDIAGNVGIGTSAPGAKLDVNGQIRIQGGNPANNKVLVSDAGGTATWQSVSAAHVNTGDGLYWSNDTLNNVWAVNDSNIYNTNPAKVGIGTNTPTQKLDVAGQVRIQGGNPGLNKVLISDSTGTGSWQALGAAQINTGDGLLWYGDTLNSVWRADSNNIYFNSGNVGIGTNNPSKNLDIVGNAAVSENLYIDGFNLRECRDTVIDTVGWYRIAQINTGSSRGDAEFTLTDKITGGGHSTLRFSVGINYNEANGTSFILKSHSKFSFVTFTKIRIIKNSTYDGSFLEVYCNRTGQVKYCMWDNEQSNGWSPVNWEQGNIPTGWDTIVYETNNIFAIGSNAQHFTIDRRGYVGIGTSNLSSPLGKLVIKADPYPYADLISFRNNGDTAQWHINLDYGNLNFVESGVAEHRLYLQKGGNVGINTPTPLGKLSVFTGSADSVPALFVDGGGNSILNTVAHLSARSSNFASTVLKLTSNRESSSAYNFIDAIQDVDGNSDTVFVVRGDGRVGIGTQVLNSTLNIEGSSSPLKLKSTTSGCIIELFTPGWNNADLRAGYIGFPTNTSSDILITNQSTTGSIKFFTKSTYRMAIDSNGFVGLSLSPSYQLHLSQNSAAKPTSNTWTVASDKRLKTGISPYTGGLDDIKRINPVWFTYTGEAGMPKDRGVGVLAQELQEIAPYMVNEWQYKDENGKETTYLGVDNGAMTYMLINAVKEQQKEIESLKNEIEILKRNKQ